MLDCIPFPITWLTDNQIPPSLHKGQVFNSPHVYYRGFAQQPNPAQGLLLHLHAEMKAYTSENLKVLKKEVVGFV